MEIVTEFKVNDLIQHKYKRNTELDKSKGATALEIIEIQTQTCSAGTQVFYLCRPIFVMYEKDWSIEKKDRAKFISDVLMGDKADLKLREDEVKACPQDVIDIIKD